MSFPDSRIPINKGSDWEDVVSLVNADDTPFDLLNYTVSIFDESAALTGLVSVSVLDEAAGQILLRINWSDTLETAIGYQFRVRLFNDPDDTTSNVIGVIYQ
jgi:hypothetical protein